MTGQYLFPTIIQSSLRTSISNPPLIASLIPNFYKNCPAMESKALSFGYPLSTQADLNGSKSILPYSALAKSLAAFAKVVYLAHSYSMSSLMTSQSSLHPSTTAKLFADDIKLYSSSSNISPSNLQSQLNIIQLWSSTRQLKISHSKCNILPIGPHLTNNTFHIDNIDISTVEQNTPLI